MKGIVIAKSNVMAETNAEELNWVVLYFAIKNKLKSNKKETEIPK